MRLALIAVALLIPALFAAEFPSAGISNEIIRARLLLPDAQNGYYRATRFDWSGVIASLRYKDHEYFGPWFARHDPLINDAITGPVEEFRSNDGGLGYGEARPGGAFIRIGVGVVRKPDEPQYQPFRTYEIVDPGKWTITRGPDRVSFVHELAADTGYAYVYRKTVRLAPDSSELILEDSIENTGRRVIETEQYNHNFFVIDNQPAGPDFVVRFPFQLRARRDIKGPAELRGAEIAFLRPLADGESAYAELEGFGSTAADYSITVENRRTGAGVRIRGDRPLSRLVFWSIRTTVCPEPYISIRVEPGRTFEWRIAYQFYAEAKGTATPRQK